VTRASIAFDQVADSYDATRGGLERGRVIGAALHRLLPDGPLLEVGIGTGLVGAALAELGRPVVGVDLSVPMLVRAAARLPGRVAVGDSQRLPVGTGAVGGAYLVHVLHLVGDLGATLDEVHRVLRPGGLLAATTRPGEDQDSNDVWDLVMTLYRSFPHAGRRPDQEHAVVAAAREHGFVPERRLEIRRPGVRSAPREVADGIEARLWSWMWSIPDEEWLPVAAPIVARIRALPDQDRPRGGEEVSPVLTFRRD
jgi:SAM-dependent methyltransferase